MSETPKPAVAPASAPTPVAAPEVVAVSTFTRPFDAEAAFAELARGLDDLTPGTMTRGYLIDLVEAARKAGSGS